MTAKTKIVLDADVIIHFVKAGQFSLLLDIFPEYQYLILDVVYDEVTVSRAMKTQIDNTLTFLASRVANVKNELSDLLASEKITNLAVVIGYCLQRQAVRAKIRHRIFGTNSALLN